MLGLGELQGAADAVEDPLRHPGRGASLEARVAGQVITITSTAGLIGQEFCAAYAASKFGLEGWMESLRYDLAPYGISTMSVEPGFFRTELLVEGSSTIWPDLQIDDYDERTAQTIEAWKGMNGRQGGDPAKLGRALVTLSDSGDLPSGSSPAPTR